MAMTVWYIPGWMRTEKPRAEVMACVSKAFPQAMVEFKAWDGDRLVWPHAVESADKEAWRFAFEAAMLPNTERENLIIVGHSLGGRITTRILARLAEKGLRVREGVLLAAALPSDDPDLKKMGGGSTLPVLAICNPDDVTLRYVYATVGGENAIAFGANGALDALENVKECVTPSDLTRQVKIEADWGKVQALKDVANHCELFYLAYLQRLLDGEAMPEEVMVYQSLPTFECRVKDSVFWWETLAEVVGWKLQRNRITGHARIIDPQRVRRAWGRVEDLTRSFEKISGQLM